MPRRLTSTGCHTRLYAYWDQKRAGRRMPSRADITPTEIRGLLPNIMLLDVTGDGFRYRLVGTGVVADMGRDLTGARVGSYVKPAQFAAEVIESLVRVRDSGAPVFTVGGYAGTFGARHWVSRLLLPLGADHTKVDMILASRVARYPHGRTAKAGWLGQSHGNLELIRDVTSLARLVELCDQWERGPAAITAA